MNLFEDIIPSNKVTPQAVKGGNLFDDIFEPDVRVDIKGTVPQGERIPIAPKGEVTTSVPGRPNITPTQGAEQMSRMGWSDEEIKREAGGVEGNPWIDPLTVATTAGGMTGIMAKKAGAGLAEVAKRGMVSAVSSGAMQIPIGTVTDVVGEKYPKAALPLNLALGIASGMTIERAFDSRVNKALSRGAEKVKTNLFDNVISEARPKVEIPSVEDVAPIAKEAIKAEPPKPKTFMEALSGIAETSKTVDDFEAALTKTGQYPQAAKTARDAGFKSIREFFDNKGALPLREEVTDTVASFTHDDLANAAVTGKDSLNLQNISPDVKPVVKMTRQELVDLKKSGEIGADKQVFSVGDTGYVIDPNAVHSVIGAENKAASVNQAKRLLRQGGDAESTLLGYPNREGLADGEKITGAVTKQGDMALTPDEVKAHADNGNLIYGMEGRPEDVVQKVGEVAEAIKKQKPPIEAVMPPLVKAEATPYSFKADIKQRLGLDDDEISYLSKELADDLRFSKDPKAVSNAKTWENFAETGQELSSKGATKGQTLSAIEFGKDRFEQKARDYINWKQSQAGDIQAGSLAYGMKLPKYAINVNLDRIDADYSAKKMILDVSDIYARQIKEAKQGKIPLEETRKRADELLQLAGGKFKTDQFIGNVKTRTQDLDAYITASRDILNTSAQRLVELQRQAAELGTDEALASFRMAMEKHAWIQAEVGGASSKIGRALSAHRVQSQASKNYKLLLDSLGGREINEEIIKKFSEIDVNNPVQVNTFVREVSKAKTSDMIYEAWINAILSNPLTHIVNSTSNALTFLAKYPEKATSATVDAVRSAITGKPRERYFGEIAADAFSSWKGYKEGVKTALWSLANEMPSDALSKIEVATQQAIPGKAGEVIRTPGRFLMAADEFFKGLNYTTELHGIAFRQAMKEGLAGEARAKRISEIIANPSDMIKAAADKERLYRTFQAELSGTFKKVAGMRHGEGYGSQVMRYIAPFVRTPVNIAKYGLERTPLAFIDIARRQLSKNPLEAGELVDRTARAALGTAIGAMVYGAAAEGFVTAGGLKDREKRDNLYRTGWQPYSFKVGDKYYSYARLEPLGSIFGMAADLFEGYKEKSEDEKANLVGRIVRSVGTNVSSKTFIKGVSEALLAWTDPDRHAEKWVNSFAGTVVPSVVGGAARVMDKTLRETNTTGEYVKSRVPFLSDDLFPKRDIWGQPIERSGPGIGDKTDAAIRGLSPVQVSAGKGFPVDKEIVRLKVEIGRPQRKVRDIELTSAQYDELLTRGGARAEEMVNRFISGSEYKQMPDETKAKMIKRLYENAMDLEKGILYQGWRKLK